MRTVITGYSEISKAGNNGEQIMDGIVEELKETLGSKVEYDGEEKYEETNLYKITVIIEKLVESK